LPLGAALLAFTEKDSSSNMEFYKAFGSSLTFAYAMKIGINRQRPNGSDHSFPSGHTTAAFSGAGFIHKKYGWQYAAPAYAAASFVGWSRVYSNKHWASDVLVGAVIGIAGNVLFVKKKKGKPRIRYGLMPIFNDTGMALTVNYPIVN